MALPVFLTEDGLVTDAQVRRLREKRMAGKTLAAAAAAAGMSGGRRARRRSRGAVHAARRALRAPLGDGDEQPGVQPVGPERPGAEPPVTGPLRNSVE